jgi:outer membrane protein OmpA-like peptidoglycan-associated protein
VRLGGVLEILEGGYTRELKRGSIPCNQELSGGRAQAVKDYFVVHGVAEDRLLEVGDGEALLAWRAAREAC